MKPVAQEPVMYVARARCDSETTVAGELSLEDVSETPFDMNNPDVWECLPLYATPPSLEAPLTDALRDLVSIIDAAGLLSLSRGVDLGPTVWYVKASERMDYARALLGARHDR